VAIIFVFTQVEPESEKLKYRDGLDFPYYRPHLRVIEKQA